MSQVATKKSKAILDTPKSSARSTSERPEGGQRLPPSPSGRMSDIALASAVAQVVSAVPGVVDLSPGCAAPVVTYGPGQRVVGVLIYHPAAGMVVFEVHVILREACCQVALADSRSEVATLESAHDHHDHIEPLSPISEIANQIRKEVRCAVQNMASLVPLRIDVFIDDLR